MLKTPKTIGLLAVPVVLAAAVVSASGAFAKAPAHPSQPTTEPTTAATTESATEPASTETADAAGGHADDPNDPNADHQFNGEE